MGDLIIDVTRLTQKQLEDKIVAVRWVFGSELTPDRFAEGHENDKSTDCLTLCIITLQNGYTVTGQSACISREVYDVEVGKELAYKNAFRQIWALEGYLLKERLFRASHLLNAINE
ncbi:Gp49 family protein [Acinetobacter bouvetii]|uniref:Uncharacterized protein n=1 Tax=Acinetobacter bouvetii TaxID=202951 RepID=A0A811GE07_9GAMM|nr:Gp49 family protein [Acinetobacter bouvetii]CAB1222464.1 hypothetical protein SFB21_3125 [Acinetobacter bouvetii]